MHVVRDREFFLVSFLFSCDASEKAIEKILVASDMNFSLCVSVFLPVFLRLVSLAFMRIFHL